MKVEFVPEPQPSEVSPPPQIDTPSREEEPVPMTPMRKVIAQNLVAAQRKAALLTTFNEVDMSPGIALRKRYRDWYRKRHGVQLGFMSLFVKASVEALREVPAVNARIDGAHIVDHRFQDIGMAVGEVGGFVVPVLRNVESMSVADIERTIVDFAFAYGATGSNSPSCKAGHLRFQMAGSMGRCSDANSQSSAKRHARDACHSGQAGSGRWKGGDSAEDVPDTFLRSPHYRRAGSGDVPATDQGPCGEPGVHAARSLSAPPTSERGRGGEW